MKNLFLAALLCISLPTAAQTGKPTRTNSAEIEAKVDRLLSKMTLEEKILQLNQTTAGLNDNPNNIETRSSGIDPQIGSIIFFSDDPLYRNEIQKKAIEQSRLGIPILFGFDVIHGFKTLYPIPLAQGCSWNPELVKKASEAAAAESTRAGVNWTFSPMIDIARDPRWGRVAESYGEDPYCNARFCVATVNGYQGKSLSEPNRIAACLKHFVGYGVSEGGRDYHYTDISQQTLWDTYLIPYEAGIKAGAATVMSSFNDLNGVPTTANKWLLTTILKDKWKHRGFVVSDWQAVEQLITQGVAKDKAEAAQKALMAGVELDMLDYVYRDNLKRLVEEKKVPLSRIDDAVRRILRIKFELGLFDNPYTTIVDPAKRFLQPDAKAVAQQLAEESIVLLKNERNILPLTEKQKQILLVGPMAKNTEDIMGSWTCMGRKEDTESFFQGMQAEFGNKAQILFEPGSDFEGSDTTNFRSARVAASKSDVVILCLGEKRTWSGENASRSSISLPWVQEELVRSLKKSGKPIVLVLFNGRPLGLEKIEPLADAIVEAWQPGTFGGTPLAGIVSGRINPSGKLSITFPRNTGQIPLYYNMRSSARPTQGKYQDSSNEPLYWMGHGLSYTTYSYSDVKLTKKRLSRNETLTAEITVKNTGTLDGKETVLWYIQDPVCRISRPLKELKYFEKKEIAAGGETVFTFVINPVEHLGFIDSEGNKFFEPGQFVLMVNGQRVEFEVD
jgi:beta-glucosidase